MPTKNLSVPALGEEVVARFWAKVDKGDGCWLWTASKSDAGYGRFKANGRTYYAHRVAYALDRGDDTGVDVSQTCGNRLCVNPDHLAGRRVDDANRNGRPAKPRPDFPLFPHATGRWAKKVRGKLHYFGKVADDPKGERAINLWLDERDDLLAGRTPRTKSGGLTVRELVNRFLTAKENQRDAGDIRPRTFIDYHKTCEVVVAAFGKNRLVVDLAADDFEALRATLAKRRNPNTLGNEVQRVRVLFKYAYDAGLVEHPVRYGPTFKRPSKRILRAERYKKGPRLFEAEELRAIIKAADQPLRAMIHLGVNCGFGNNDCGTLPLSALDLDGGWIDYPRPKTAIERRCPLWPETVESIRESLACRREPKLAEHAGLVFVTRYGFPWAKDAPDSPVTKEFRKLLDRLGLHRPGLGFYALRHTFETIAGGARDQVSVDHVMGHADTSMAAHYRERIDDSRLVDCVNHVRAWLFPKPKKKAK